MKKWVTEFKMFAFKGNLIELAVAVILGLAFAAVITALVEFVIMPLVAAVVGQSNFDKLVIDIGDAKLEYGRFLTALVNFLIVAIVLFLVVKAANKAMRPAGAPVEPPTTRECPYCKTAIPITATRCAACTSEVQAPV